ncbi:MAG TPA: SRPBCC family protein [Sporichthya sp.]|nr:SRPBCC family protein [Sporichthya sp.]
MARNSRVMSGLTPRQVFLALADGEHYDRWVVGTRMIRTAEPGWPTPGTAIHYTIGYGPLRKDDKTVSRSLDPDRHIELEAQAWPFGTVRIAITAEAVADGCRVTIDEHPQRGVARKLHNPAVDLLIKIRNVETLRRLEQHSRNIVRAG